MGTPLCMMDDVELIGDDDDEEDDDDGALVFVLS